MQEIYEAIERNIRDHKRQVIGVMGGSDSFFYTIGNSLAGMPELVLCLNMEGNSATVLLNLWSERQLKMGRGFEDGEFVYLSDGQFPVCARWANATVKTERTVQAGQFLGREDYQVVQMVVPDKAGLLPWQPGCAAGFRDQPLYFPRPC